MAERLIISVEPASSSEAQKVQDVFGHVLDLFDLLAHSGQVEDDAIAWRLVSVSMNSPITIVAEAIAVRPAAPVVVDLVARRQRQRFSSNIAELKTGRVPDVWRGPRESKVRRAFNVAQPATTRVSTVNDGTPFEEVAVLPVDLITVNRALEAAALESVPRPKQQRGSIEGEILEVGLYYTRPAIKIRERKFQREVWCTVTEEHRAAISNETNFEDVWNGRRVRVEGVLQYDATGDLSRIYVESLERMEPREVPLQSLMDPEFTQGLGGAEYLERLREGTLD